MIRNTFQIITLALSHVPFFMSCLQIFSISISRKHPKTRAINEIFAIKRIIKRPIINQSNGSMNLDHVNRLWSLSCDSKSEALTSMRHRNGSLYRNLTLSYGILTNTYFDNSDQLLPFRVKL